MGKAIYVIGIKIHRDKSLELLRLYQKTSLEYWRNLGRKKYYPRLAPIVKGDKLNKLQNLRNEIEKQLSP